MDGLELLRKIRDGEIEVGTVIFDSDGNEYRYDEDEGGYPMVKQKDSITGDEYEPSLSMFTDKDTEFTIVEKEKKEKEEDIDIQDIKELEDVSSAEKYSPIIIGNRNKINELVKAVKQLDKKLEE